MQIFFRIGVFIAIAYALLITVAFIWQRKMIYFPDRGKPTVDQALAMGLQFWPNPDNNYRGFIASLAPVKSKGTIVVFHGNAGAAWHRSYYVQALEPLGYTVILAEYPGYGGRDGIPSEDTFVKDASITLRMAHEAFGGPLYLWGESLGCGVAAALVKKSPLPVDGVVLVTPWDSLPDLAQSLYWYFPVRRLLRDRFDNINNLRTFQGPVAVALSVLDEIIPTKRSLRLYEHLPPQKRLWRFEQAGHNNWPTDPAEPWWREVMQFVTSPENR